MPNLTEPTFNTYFVEALKSLNPKWHQSAIVERTHVFVNSMKQPDIVLQTEGGHMIVIETEFMPANTLEADAKSRFSEVFKASESAVETVVAIRIPRDLRTIEGSIFDSIIQSSYEYCVYSRSEVDWSRWPTIGWLESDIHALTNCLDLVSISERLINEGVNHFERAVRRIAYLIDAFRRTERNTGRRIPEILHQEHSYQTYCMVGAIITNAVVYQEILARHYDIESLSELADEDLTEARLIGIWKDILTNINFYPIFKLARDLLISLGSRLAQRVTDSVIDIARSLANLGITTLYDLSGRMFQKLIADRKFLATFYTLPSSSALLSEFALSRVNIDWGEPTAYNTLRIVDFACGTGTLLAASYRGILRRYEGLGLNSADIHASMLAESVYAADIMPAATHMAASQLAGFHPYERLLRTLVHTVPYGEQTDKTGRDVSIGSLDFLSESHVETLFGTGSESVPLQVGDGINKELRAPDGYFDLVIMNPPFTRPTNHKLADVPVPSFAGFSSTADEQRAMSVKLKKIYKNLHNHVGHGNAGLASNFCDLAHQKLKVGGVLAVVLPISALSGESWRPFRLLLAREYKKVTIFTIAARKSSDRSFSADTDMAECLIVGERCEEREDTEQNWKFVSLNQRPNSIPEGVAIANLVVQHEKDSYGLLKLGEINVGHHFNGSSRTTGLASISSLDLALFLKTTLQDRKIGVRSTPVCELPLVELSLLGSRGPVDRDVGVTNLDSKSHRGPFAINKSSHDVDLYPCLWWHDSLRERQIFVAPDSSGTVISGREEQASKIWQTASRLHISRDFNTTAASITACLTTQQTLGGRAWPTFLCNNPKWESVLALWFNCSLGLMIIWWHGSKQHSGRSINTVSKLPGLPVFDARVLTEEQLQACENFCTTHRYKELLPASKAYQDDVRKEIDNFVFSVLLQAPDSLINDFQVIRELWCREPIVSPNRK